MFTGVMDGLGKIGGGLLDIPNLPIKIPGLEDRLLEEAAKSARSMLDNLSQQEMKQVGFVPLVITELAWIYAQQARDAAARNRLDMFRKLSGVFDQMRKGYDDWLARDLDYANRKRIKIEAEALMRDYERDFTILSMCCDQELKRVAPEFYYEDVRIPAIVSMELVGLVGAVNSLNDMLLSKRNVTRPSERTEMNPYTAWMGENMECYAGVDTKTFNYKDKNILIALTVIKNKAIAREYNILNK